MARPFTATDEQILEAAHRVLQRRGPDGFSMAEVATEVGLSRAAIILRFSSTQALKLKVLTKHVDQFAQALEGLPKILGGDGLLHVAAFLGTYVGTREGSANYFAKYAANVRDHEEIALEERRGEVLGRAIGAVMPQVAIDRDAAVNAFRAHLAGTILSWLASKDSNSRRYVLLRTQDWLTLAGIAFSKQVADDLITAAQRERGRVTTLASKRATKPRRARS